MKETIETKNQKERIQGKRWEGWEKKAVEQLRGWKRDGYKWIRVNLDGICYPQKNEPPTDAKWVDEKLNDDQGIDDEGFKYPEEYIRVDENNENAITTVAMFLIGTEAIGRERSRVERK